MKALILTCNTGQGHNSSAQAIQEIFTANNHTCDIADALGFFSKKASKLVDTCFTGIYRYMPKAFQVGYARTDAYAANLPAADYLIHVLAPGAKRLHKHIIANGYTHIICVHLFSAVIATYLRRKYQLQLGTAFLPTDYTCYPFTEKTDLDLYLLPHADLADDYVCAGIAREKMVPTGIPVRSAFLQLEEKNAARRALDLPENAKVIFQMGGSMGCGPMEDLALALSDTLGEDIYLLISCGTNEKLLRLLEKHASTHIRPFRYANNVPQIMAAADLFITKPGGISITEAGVAGLPMLLLDVIGGCETPNYQFFTGHSYANGASSTADAVQKCRDLLASPNILLEQSKQLRTTFGKNAAQEIFNAVSVLNI